MAVPGAFGDDDDRITPPGLAPGFQSFAHQLAPVIDIRRAFGDQHPICADASPPISAR